MAEDVELTDEEQSVFEAVAELEGSEESATIQQVASVTGLDTHRAEEVLGRLTTTHDLVRELQAELDDDATGAGRHYVVKVEPSPR